MREGGVIAGFYGISILTKVGNGRHIDVRAWPRPSRSAWAENIASVWLPIQTYGNTFKGHN